MQISNSSRPQTWRWCGFSRRWLPGVVLLGVLAGCGEPPQIMEYTIKKPDRQPQPAFDHPPMQPMNRPSLAAGKAKMPSFEAPESWQKIPNTRMSEATFQVTPDDKDTLVTLIPMAPLSDSLLRPNVDRWRKQVGLAPLKPAEDPQDSFETIQLADGTAGRYLKLVGAGADKTQAMLTLIATTGGRTWYFKLMGNAEVVLEEEPRFKAFVQSVRFSPEEEAGDE